MISSYNFHLYSWFSAQQRSKPESHKAQGLNGIAQLFFFCILFEVNLWELHSQRAWTFETEFSAVELCKIKAKGGKKNLFWDNFSQSTALFFRFAAVTIDLIKSSFQTFLHHPKALHNHFVPLCHIRQRQKEALKSKASRKLGGNVNNHHCTARGSGWV